MKALVYKKYGNTDRLRVTDVPVPKPGRKEVLVRVKAASLNSWDVDLLRGRPWIIRMWGLFRPGKQILGADVAGIVEMVGEDVTNFVPGDPVYGDLSNGNWGGFAEYVAAREDQLLKKPAYISFDEMAAVPQAGAMAMQCFYDKPQALNGQKILINGAGGGVGTIALQVAKLKGALITAVDRADKLDRLIALGADEVIDYRKTDFTRTGQQYDLIIDVTATRYPGDYARALSEEGRYLMIGGKGRSIISCMLWGRFTGGRRHIGILAHAPNRHMDTFLELFQKGHVRPLIDQAYPLEKGAEAFGRLQRGEVFGKVIINP